MSTDHPITVGSSDVASILGLNPKRSRQETWLRLVGLLPRYEHAVANTEQARGHLLERALLLDWEERNGLKLTRSSSVAEAPDSIKDGWKHARCDGWIEGRVIVEAKTTRTFDPTETVIEYSADGEEKVTTYRAWGEDGSAQIPMGYKSQVVWQMHVHDIPVVSVPAFATLSEEQRTYTLERDLEAEAIIVAKVEAFMVAYVWCEVLTPPPPLTYEVVHALHADGGRGKEWLPARSEDLMLGAEIALLAHQAKANEARFNAIKTQLCDRIGDLYGIEGVARWEAPIIKETVALAKAKKAHPHIYQQLDALGLINRSKPARRFVPLAAKDTGDEA